MRVRPYLVADAESFELVVPGEGALLRSSARRTSCIGATLRPRSGPADVARPSPRCSQPAPRGRPASSWSCAARKRFSAEQHGHPPATVRDTDAFEADAPAAAELYVPIRSSGTRSADTPQILPTQRPTATLLRSVPLVTRTVVGPARAQASAGAGSLNAACPSATNIPDRGCRPDTTLAGCEPAG